MEERRRNEEIAVLSEIVNRTDSTVTLILKLLNGKGGLITQTELNKASIKRIWWFISVLSVAVIGICSRILYAAIN